jgi:hypothetical protein
MSFKRQFKILCREHEDISQDGSELKAISAAPCDETFEANLCPDLQLLAEQLTEDALRLSLRYPSTAISFMPPSFSKAPRKNTAPRRSCLRSSRYIAAAALVLVAFGGIAIGWRLHGSVEAARANHETANNHVAPFTNEFSAAPNEGQANQTIAAKKVDRGSTINAAGIQEIGYHAAETTASRRSELEMLRAQLTAFGQVIHRLQDELARRAKSDVATAKTIEMLQNEIDQLRPSLREQLETIPNP